MLEQLIERWGYLAIVVGTFLEGEAMLLVGVAMAHRGLLSLPLVGLSALVGSVANDQLWFQVGRHRGRSWLARRPSLARQVEVVERWIQRWGTLFVLSFRFLYGLRTLSPIVLGMSDYPALRFALLNVAGAALWAAVFALGGYGLVAAVASVLGRASRLEEALLLGVLVAVVLYFAAHRRERKADREVSIERERAE